jgi:hypothetical protein
VVPYHDLRALASASGQPIFGRPSAAAYREIAARSLAELDRRERGSCDLGVSDLLTGLGAGAVHTVNHPANGLLIALARRLQAAAGAPADAADPGRELLGGIRAPLDAEVLDALGLDAAPRPDWCVDGRPVPVATVIDRQIAWYRSHPGWVTAGLERYAADLRALRG